MEKPATRRFYDCFRYMFYGDFYNAIVKNKMISLFSNFLIQLLPYVYNSIQIKSHKGRRSKPIMFVKRSRSQLTFLFIQKFYSLNARPGFLSAYRPCYRSNSGHSCRTKIFFKFWWYFYRTYIIGSFLFSLDPYPNANRAIST